MPPNGPVAKRVAGAGRSDGVCTGTKSQHNCLKAARFTPRPAFPITRGLLAPKPREFACGMSVSITCKSCGSRLNVSDGLYDKKIRGRVVTIGCKKCGTDIVVDGTHPDGPVTRLKSVRSKARTKSEPPGARGGDKADGSKQPAPSAADQVDAKAEKPPEPEPKAEKPPEPKPEPKAEKPPEPKPAEVAKAEQEAEESKEPEPPGVAGANQEAPSTPVDKKRPLGSKARPTGARLPVSAKASPAAAFGSALARKLARLGSTPPLDSAAAMAKLRPARSPFGPKPEPAKPGGGAAEALPGAAETGPVPASAESVQEGSPVDKPAEAAAPKPETSTQPRAIASKAPVPSPARDEQRPSTDVAPPTAEDRASQEPKAPVKIVDADLDDPPTLIDHRFAKWAQLDELIEDEGDASEKAPPTPAVGASPANADAEGHDTDPADALLDAPAEDDDEAPSAAAPPVPERPADVPEVPGPAAAAAADVERPESGGRSWRVLLIVGLVVLVAAGFGGVLFAMLGGKESEAQAEGGESPSPSAVSTSAPSAQSDTPAVAASASPVPGAEVEPEPEAAESTAAAEPDAAESAQAAASKPETAARPSKPAAARKPSTPRKPTPRRRPKPPARKPSSPGAGTFVPGEL